MSASFGRLQASLAAATNELTVAAANINFDFTLVKYEAPKEFQPLGELLTWKRKHEAENGRSHITARRLGALFDGVCPDTPNLIKAYGTRVAEVSKQAVDNEPKEYRESIFSAYTGVDGTSIWAAATSSKTAIHVHMLACMLAEFWDPPESVSVWEELVAERRRDIATRVERGEPMHIALAAAAQQDISRQDLAVLDASARAWIHTARTVMRVKYTQLKLILKNLDTFVNEKTDVFGGVTEAWKLTLETMEKLVSGIPQEARRGAAVLGISAWHIYPDIHLFGARNVEVQMNDPLVQKGGILSLGCSPSDSQPGVHWSLCLNHFKFYGSSVQRKGNLQDNFNMVPFRNLHHAIIGAILSKWEISTEEVSTGLQVFISLCSLMSAENPFNVSMLKSTRIAAEECRDDPSTREFFNYGRRKSQFLSLDEGEEDEPWAPNSFIPYFGLSRGKILLNCFQNHDDRVDFLRRMAARVDLNDMDVVLCDTQNLQVHIMKSHTDSLAGKLFKEGPVRLVSRQKFLNIYSGWILDSDNDKLVYTGYLNKNRKTFHLWFGELSTAAIFFHSRQLQTNPKPARITAEDLRWCLEHQMLSGKWLLQDSKAATSMLYVIAEIEFAADCFNQLPTVMVDMRSLGRPLFREPWVDTMMIDLANGVLTPPQHRFLRDRFVVGRHATIKDWISVIAWLAAGVKIPLETIPSGVIGISTGDSLLVPSEVRHLGIISLFHRIEPPLILSQLLNDPCDRKGETLLTRILGNVGRPGFVLLISPEEPMLAPLDTVDWRMCNMNPFDGKGEDMLNSTSLHLSFTDWSRPVNLETTIGHKAVESLVIESVVSIRERGKWVGDIDPTRALRNRIVSFLAPQDPCSHAPNEPPAVPMTAVECWDELRDCPEKLVVVKAHGNWVARLAATAYLVECSKQTPTKVKRITVCPQRVCWACLEPEFESNVYIY